MRGHLLGVLQLAAVFEVIGDAGGARAVIPGPAADVGLAETAAHHAVNARLGPARGAALGAKQGPFGVAQNFRRLDISSKNCSSAWRQGISFTLPPFSCRRSQPRRPWI